MCADGESVPYLELEPSMAGAAERVTRGIRVRAHAWPTPQGDSDGTLLDRGDIGLLGPRAVHDVAMTERYD